MTTHTRLLGILVAVSGLGLAVAAGGTSKDTWKGAWKFEMDRWDRPWVGYYDTRGILHRELHIFFDYASPQNLDVV